VDDSKISFTPTKGKTRIDTTDHKILNILANNARTTLIDISKKLNKPVRTINYRIKRLEKNIIIGYRASINKNVLGLKTFRLRFESATPITTIKDFAETNPMITRYEEMSPFDYEFIAEVESIEGLMDLIQTVLERFSPVKNYSYNYIIEKKEGIYVPR
jgi:DNA-binding Lrp family transcriptional regulator